MSGNFSIGSRRQDFVVNVNDPYFLDSKVGMGLDAFNSTREFTDFKEKKLGFGVNSSYPLKDFSLPFFRSATSAPAFGSAAKGNDQPSVLDFMRAGLSYDFTRENISEVSASAPQSIQDEKGRSVTSSVTPGITYDSRDHFFNPTEGTKLALSSKMAGLGGDSRFVKNDLSGRWHYPLLKDPSWGGSYVLALGGSLGYGIGLSDRKGDSDLPLFERYFLGGINSVRGFTERSLGPRAPSGCTTDATTKKTTCTGTDVIGGDKSAVLNAELLFPVMEQYGLRGVAFFDMGNSFNAFDFADMRRSVGVGARWMSPFGPLRVELGFPITKKPGDDTSVLGFSVGGQ